MASTKWISSAAPPAVRPAHCHVWWATPSLARDWHVRLLSPGEHDRRARLRQAADRDRFTVGCALLRIVVGRATGVSPAALELDRSCPDCARPHGKPRPRHAPGLDCSVSHSGDRVAVAVARCAAIGVDVEEIEPGLDVRRLADRICAPAEVASLEQLPAEDRPWGFSTTWTRKEAILKATGYGLRVAPDQVRVSSPLEPPRLLDVGDVPFPSQRVTLHRLDPGEGYAASLAALNGPLTAVTEFDAAPLLAAPTPRS